MTRLSRSVALLAFLTPLVLPTLARADINEDPGEGGDGGDSEPPPPPPPGYWSKLYSKSDMFGTSSWAAGYSASLSLSATPAASAPSGKDTLRANAVASANARLDGTTHSMFSVRASGVTEAKARTALDFTVYVAGAAFYSRSYASATSTYTPLDEDRSWPKTFVNKSTTIWAGPIPVALSLTASGRLAVKLTGKISNVGIEANSAPSAGADLYATAGVGFEYCELGICVAASGGVYVDLQLLEVDAPASGAVWWSLTRSGGVVLRWLAKAQVILSTLDGELGVYAHAALEPLFNHTWDHELLDWDGFDATYTLVDLSGSHCLVGLCGVL